MADGRSVESSIPGSKAGGAPAPIWLKLRFDDALQRGEQAGVGTRKLRSVLIRRRSGSLKDALEQLVEQLPEYERYLAKIRAAIADVSGDTAKRRLYSEMHHSLYAGRRDAPKMLRHLDEVFNANATVKHLCRDGGAIDRNIRRLTEHSDASAREALPPFTAEDFSFPPNARSGYDEDLGLRLEDDESVKEQAAARATAHLREAIAGLTGLRGHTLNEIFRQIREQMQRQDEVTVKLYSFACRRCCVRSKQETHKQYVHLLGLSVNTAAPSSPAAIEC